MKEREITILATDLSPDSKYLEELDLANHKNVCVVFGNEVTQFFFFFFFYY